MLFKSVLLVMYDWFMINFPWNEILSSITEGGAMIIKLKSLSLFNLRDHPGFRLGAIRYSVAWFPHAKAEDVVSLFVAFSLTSSSFFLFLDHLSSLSANSI